jgi:hypothetical protein
MIKATNKIHGHKIGDTFQYGGRASKPLPEGVQVTLTRISGGIIRLSAPDREISFGTAMKFWS